MTPSVKASSSSRLSADRSGGVLTHRLNPKLAPVRIRKIVLAVDHPHSVTFPTHHGEALALCQPASDWTSRSTGGRSAVPEPTHDVDAGPAILGGVDLNSTLSASSGIFSRSIDTPYGITTISLHALATAMIPESPIAYCLNAASH